MAEEPTEAPAETQDTLTSAAEVAAESGPPAEETPAQQPGESSTDWEKRYKDLQSEYTRTTQEAAELRRAQEASQQDQVLVDALSDPTSQDQAIQHLVTQLGEDGAREWLEQHGFEVEDETESEDFRDPRVDQLLAERQQEQANRQVTQIEQQMESTLDGIAKEASVELSDKVRNLILDAAVSRWSGDPGADVKSVFEEWNAEQEAAIKAYRQTKRNPPTPPVPGSAGTPNPSLGDPKARLARANEIALEALQSS